MELYLQNHNYQYAVEQLLFHLFPGERLHHVQTPPQGAENSLFSSLVVTDCEIFSESRLVWRGQHYAATHRVPLMDTLSPQERGRLENRTVKQSLYLAAVQALDAPPPWGSLSGVRPVKLPTRSLLAGATPEEAQRMLEEEFHVSPLRAKLALQCAQASCRVQEEFPGDSVSLYVGIPFCPTRCVYCSFVSAGMGKALKLIEPFLDLLLEEVAMMGGMLREAGKTIQTIYMGGGTPTTLSAPQLDRLLTAMRAQLPMAQGAEFTIEMGRPDTITAEKLALCAPHGVSRISINPQTMESHVLKAMGRTHSPEEILDCYALARSLPQPLDINMDLIAGLPYDTVEGFGRSLTQVIGLRPENITVHTLAIKKGSALSKDGSGLPTAQAVSQMLALAWSALHQAGYQPYYLYRQKYMSGGFENISWCLPGKENKYNIIMMEELHAVLSLGAGGITRLVNPETGDILRLNNPKYPHDYLRSGEKIAQHRFEILDFWKNGGSTHGLSNSRD